MGKKSKRHAAHSGTAKPAAGSLINNKTVCKVVEELWTREQRAHSTQLTPVPVTRRCRIQRHLKVLCACTCMTVMFSLHGVQVHVQLHNMVHVHVHAHYTYCSLNSNDCMCGLK